MATGATFAVGYRRKRQQKTDYHRRLNLLKSEKTRFVVRPSNKSILTQLVDYHEDGDMVRVTVSSKTLGKLGWNHNLANTPAAYLTGLLCGVKGKSKGVKTAILDTGLFPQIKCSNIYAALKGLKDAGIESPADDSIFPSQERICGKVIASYNQKAKSMEADFAKVKEAILRSSK
ncbi:MAG: 50S ribosomal protein L18 [Candidatus Altiarchaeota archaeon]